MTRVIAYGASLCWFLSACSPESASVAKRDVSDGTDSTQTEETSPKRAKAKKTKTPAAEPGEGEPGQGGVGPADSGTSSTCSPVDCGDPAKLECVDGMCAQRAIWGELEVVWEDKSHDVYDGNGPFIDAFYYAGSSDFPAHCLLRLGAGSRLWQVYVGQEATLGTQVKGTFPFRDDGKSRFGVVVTSKDAQLWEIATGTATLSTLQLKSGGRVEGTMEGTLRPYGSDRYDMKGPGSAQFKLRFGAILP